MTRRYTQPAPANGPAGLIYPVVAPPAPASSPRHGRLRRHALAVAIMAATGGAVIAPDSAKAADVLCPIQESGTAVSFRRPAGTAAGDKAVYRHTPSMPNTQFYDSRGKTQIDVENCVVHIDATAGTGSQYAINYVVTDIYGNGNQTPSGSDAPRDVSFQGIDLGAMTVDGTAPNTIDVNAVGSFGEIIGSGGTAPVHITVGSSLADGMKLYELKASPDMVVRDDVITINDGVDLKNGLYGQAGNDIINLNGGKSTSGLYGDNGYDEAFFNDPANRFNDIFNVNGGDWWYLNGDGGDSTRGGADIFNFVGGIIRNNVHGDGGNDTFNFTGNTKIDGSVFGDDGADKFIISASANLNEINKWIDGGSSSSNGQYDRDSIDIHGQTFIGNGNVVSPIASIDITDIEDFRLLENTRLILSNQSGYSMLPSSGTIAHFYIDPTSSIYLEDPTTGSGYVSHYLGDMVNDGTIDLGASSPRMQVRFENYSGAGRILMSTYLGDDDSDTDLIFINGDVSGQTTLVITPVAGSPGAQTQEGITVVDANHLKSVPSTSFVMAAPITTENGLWQYRLTQNATTKDFVLTSGTAPPPPPPSPTSSPTPSPSPSPTSSPTPSPSPSPTSSPTPSPSPSPTSSPTPSPSPSPTSSPTPSPSPSPTSSPTPSPSPSPTSSPPPSPSPSPTSSPTPSPSPSPTASPTPSPSPTVPPGDHLLHPRTSVYAMGMLTAQGLVMDSLGGVSDRASLMAGGDGEIGQDDALWMRANYSQVDAGRGQFSADQRQFSLRAGKDLRGDSGSRTGVMGVVASGVAGIDDHVRPTIGGFATPLAARVGEIRTTLLGVGAYHTWFFGSDGYADVSGQVGHLWVSNDVADVDMSDTRGWSAIASAEVGNRFTVGGGGWSLIPQAQLVASHVRMKDIDDGVVRVDGDSLTAYRARVGLRFENPAGQAPRFYGLANVWRNLTDDAGTTLHGGTDTIVVAPQFARNWLEAGFGLTLPTAKAGSFNVDIRTQRGLGEDNDRSALGLQATWKLAW